MMTRALHHSGIYQVTCPIVHIDVGNQKQLGMQDDMVVGTILNLKVLVGSALSDSTLIKDRVVKHNLTLRT